MPKKSALAEAVQAATPPPSVAQPPQASPFDILESANRSYVMRLDEVAREPTYQRLSEALRSIAIELHGAREKAKALDGENSALKAKVAEFEAAAKAPRARRR